METTLPNTFSHTLHKLHSIHGGCGPSSLRCLPEAKLSIRQTELNARARWEALSDENLRAGQVKAQVAGSDPPGYKRYSEWVEEPSLIGHSVEYSHIPRSCRDATNEEYLAEMTLRNTVKTTLHLPGLTEDMDENVNDDASIKTPPTEGLQPSDDIHIASIGFLTPPESPRLDMDLKETQLYFSTLETVNHPEAARYQYHSQAGPLWDSAVEILMNSFLHPLELTEPEFVSLVCSQGNATSAWLSANARTIASRSINRRIGSRESLHIAGIDYHALSDEFLELYNALGEMDRYHFRKACRYLQTFVEYYEKHELDLTTPELCFYEDLDLVGKAKFIAMQNEVISPQIDVSVLRSSPTVPKMRSYGHILNDILADLEILFFRSDFDTEQDADCPTDLVPLKRQGVYQNSSFDEDAVLHVEDAVLHSDSSLLMEDRKSEAQSISNKGTSQAEIKAEGSSTQTAGSGSGTEVTDLATSLDDDGLRHPEINDSGHSAYYCSILGPTKGLEDSHALIPQDMVADPIQTPQSQDTTFRKKLEVADILNRERKLSSTKSTASEDSACDLSPDTARIFEDQQKAFVALMQDSKWIKVQRKYAEDLIDRYKSDVTVRIIDEDFAEISEIDLDDAERFAQDMKRFGSLRAPGAFQLTRKLLDLTNGTFRSAGLQNGVKQAYYRDALQELQASDGHPEGSFRTVGRYLKGSLLKKTQRVRKKVSNLFGGL